MRAPDKRGGVAVVTDSTSYLPRALVERWAIREVSLYVGWDGDLRPEHQYSDLDAFYARLRESPVLPTTSQPSVGDFVACFEPLVSGGRDVVSIHLASGLSGTCESRDSRQRGSWLTRGTRGGWRWSTARPARAVWAAWS